MENEKKMRGIQELDKHPLFCNQMTVSHTAAQFFLDFRLVYPQFAPDNSQTTVVAHKTVVFEPYHLKEVIEVLHENIRRYEDQYGEIKVPEPIKRAKKHPPISVPTNASSAPDYLG